MQLATKTSSSSQQAVAANTEQQSSQKNSTVKLLAPFSRAGKRHLEVGETYNMTFGQRVNKTLPSFGWMREVIFKIVGSGGTGVATVTQSADAPWNVVKELIIRDANSQPLVVADGYMLHLIRKYGGYRIFKPENGPAFSAIVTGANGSGNFEILVHLFMEFGKDGLGCLPNDEANSLYKYDLTLEQAANVYGTAPTTPPTMTVSVFVPSRGTPDAVDIFGNQQALEPPNLGTTQYWDSEQFTVSSGANVCQLKQVGNIARNHILVWRSATDNTRATAVSDGTLPAQLRLDWDKGTVFDNTDIDILNQIVYDATGYNIANDDPGVTALLYTDDDTVAGAEYGDYWLPTVAATKLTFRFKSTHAGTLQVISNYIVPGSGNIFAAPSMEING